jgi:hypothetical protein
MLVALTLLASLGLSMLALTPASAATCYGSSCFGLNPQSGSCASDAQTLLGHDYSVAGRAAFRINLRYSPSCRSGWMQLIVYPGSGGSSFAGSAWNPGGPSVGFIGHQDPNTWTGMVDATPGHNVCGGTHLWIDNVYRGWYDPGCAPR